MAIQNKRMASVCAGLAVCSVLIAAAAQAQDVSFIGRRDFDAAGSPSSVAVGDFNGDGVLDLAVAYVGVYPGYIGGLSVLLGDGDGTFQVARNFETGNGPSSVAVGDFNGDGELDLAVAYIGSYPSYSGAVSVLLGNGDGSFQGPRNFVAGDGPWSVAVGDFNGDGLQDLAVANRYSNNVSVHLGNGDGTFQGAQNFAAGSNPMSVAAGDFNGDGVLDLAVANTGSNNISVLLGRGDGTFQGSQNFGVGIQPISVAVGDFNGDGVQDLAVANWNSSTVSVLLGDGEGSFQVAHYFAVGRYPKSIAVDDFNGDGHLDLAVANDGSSNVSVLLGNGDGSFQEAQNFGTGIYPGSVAVGDFNGDGVQDLAVAHGGVLYEFWGGVSVLLGNGDGSFQAAQDFGTGRSSVSVAVGDFDGDGVEDLAVVNSGRTFPSDPGSVSVLLGNGDGSFQRAHNFRVGNHPASVAVGDFNGDGVLDLAVADRSSDSASVLLGIGNGSFQAARYFPAGTGPSSVAVGDFNGDGVLDLAVGSANVAVLLGMGDGNFQRAQNFGGAGGHSVAVGDFNGDGQPDLAGTTGSDSVGVLINNTGP